MTHEENRQLTLTLIDVQRGAIGILTAARRVRALFALAEPEPTTAPETTA